MKLLARAPLVAALALSLLSAPAAAQNLQRIAAVVNDEVVSGYDLEQRIGLVLASAGLSNDPKARAQVGRQVLRALIDETLQAQEARRFNITVGEQEIAQAIARIAGANNMSPDQIRAVLARANVGDETLRSQISSELAWRKLVVQRFAARARPSDEEVDAIYDRLQASGGQTQLQLSEIFLSIDGPTGERDARAAADRLIAELRGGAPFPALAQQFSEATTAAVGGDLGWVTPDSLPEAVAKALATMETGGVAGPIRVPGGLVLVALRDRRELSAPQAAPARFELKQIVIDAPADASQERVAEAMNEARAARERVRGCASVEDIKDDYSSLSGDLGALTLADMPPPIAAAVAGLGTGGVSEPVRTESGVHVLVVCRRIEEQAVIRAKRGIAERLQQQQLALFARRYMRDLRRDAVIELR